MPAKKKSKKMLSTPKFSRKSLTIFGLVFALIGGYFLYVTFAATEYVNYWGSLTEKNPTKTYKLTTGAGQMDVSFSNNTADVTLTIRNSANKVVGSVLSRGKKDVKLSVAVVPDTYSFTLATNQKFTAPKGYSAKIYYPTKDITIPTAIISSPLNSQTLKGIVDFTAIAQDDTGISKVEFYVDGNLLGSDPTAPYSVKWDTTKIADGDHTFSVKSYDTTGNVGEASGVAEIKNAVAPQARRFPGDPNPKVNGKAYWGAGIGGNADPARHETPTGKSLSVRRTFWQWDGATNMNSSMYRTVADDLNKNRLPFITVKTLGWAATANGTYDKDLDAMLKKLDSYGKPVWLSVHHEPEGGGGSGNNVDDPGGPAAWRAMQTRIRQRMTAVGTKNIAFMPVLMSYTWNPASGRNPEDWWVPGIWDAYIVDHYRDNENGDMFTAHWPAFVTWVEKKGLPYGTAEWGNRGTDAQAAKEIQAFWDWSFTNKKDVIVYTYFDSGLNSPNGSWELVGEPLNTFRNIMKNDTRVQRINELK